MSRVTPIVFLLLAHSLTVSAQPDSRDEMRSLDEQVQEIKSDVLGIAAELGTLEERLLFPSNTQLAVFVALADGEDFRLDAVQLEIDGELAAHYIYSFKELEALQEGGVQRIYVGNVATGDHELFVSVSGQSSSGREFMNSERFTFNKGIDPRLVELSLAGGGVIQLGEW